MMNAFALILGLFTLVTVAKADNSAPAQTRVVRTPTTVTARLHYTDARQMFFALSGVPPTSQGSYKTHAWTSSDRRLTLSCRQRQTRSITAPSEDCTVRIRKNTTLAPKVEVTESFEGITAQIDQNREPTTYYYLSHALVTHAERSADQRTESREYYTRDERLLLSCYSLRGTRDGSCWVTIRTR